MSRITINSNIASLNAERRLGQSTSSLQDAFSRLSSGLRINKASDDAAGLAVASALEIDRRVLNQGLRNLNDGVSLISIADGALNELSNLTIRLTELAEQAANGALSNTQRTALDEEASALKAEFFRISRSTKFNGEMIFEAEFGELRLQAGLGEDGGITASLGGDIGPGTFETPSTYSGLGSTNLGLALGDLNGDGLLDLVTTGYGNAGEVRLGDGAGSFGPAVSFNSTLSTRNVSLGDLNGDGILDVVGTSADLAVSLGNGDGSFQARQLFSSSGITTRSHALGDFNGDGVLDAVVAGNSGAAGRFGVTLGDGAGGFEAFNFTNDGSDRVYTVLVGDLTGDGVLDIVNVGRGDSYAGGQVSVFQGDGTGSFSAVTSFIANGTYSIYAADLADLDGDGALDLVIDAHDGGGSRVVGILRGDGAGSFSQTETLLTPTGATGGVSIADINGDGNLDIANIGASGGTATLTIFLGNGDGTFDTAHTQSVAATSARNLAFGDLNNDGVADLVGAAAVGGQGANHVFLSETTTGLSPLLDFSLNTLADARQALPLLQRKLELLASQRGQLGAFEARLTSAIATAGVTEENYISAKSQITDADVAVESAKLVRSQILQQAGAAILAQANQTPALALTLLA